MNKVITDNQMIDLMTNDGMGPIDFDAFFEEYGVQSTYLLNDVRKFLGY